MMKIQILGTGCMKCENLYKNAQQATSDSGVECQIEKITDITQIISFGVAMTPALAIDGIVKIVGKVASVDEIKELLTQD
ncbi:MAG: thioredoxin family protein [bacterium]